MVCNFNVYLIIIFFASECYRDSKNRKTPNFAFIKYGWNMQILTCIPDSCDRQYSSSAFNKQRKKMEKDTWFALYKCDGCRRLYSHRFEIPFNPNHPCPACKIYRAPNKTVSLLILLTNFIKVWDSWSPFLKVKMVSSHEKTPKEKSIEKWIKSQTQYHVRSDSSIEGIMWH